MDTKKVEACMVSTFLLYICSRFSTEVCEDDSRVFVLFVCDSFLSGVIGMHLFYKSQQTYGSSLSKSTGVNSS